jgi:membrane-bound metal-dependent hydrolase YbcI (DUF457 family)
MGTHSILGLAVLSAFGALSALAPDLDHESSKGKKMLDMALILLAAVIAIASGCGGNICIPSSISGLGSIVIMFLVIVGAYFITFILFKPRHRGITHTLAACLVFGILVFLIAGPRLALAGFIGYLSHLIADGIVKIL